jgi:hypothetical protein
MAPGVYLFDDPRLFEYVGSLGTYVGALYGIFLLARMYFGSGCGLVAASLYAFSQLGLTAGESLWQRYPIHCFFVWTIYFLALWVEKNSPRFLGAAILTSATGMYVFMEMAPVLLLMPLLWVVFRPSFRLWPVLLASILAAVIWFPYLSFEWDRGFVDVSSQLRRERLYFKDFSASWCDPGAMPEGWRQEIQRGLARLARPPEPVWNAARRWASQRARLTASELLLAHFAYSKIPGGSAVLLALTVIGLVAVSIRTATTGPQKLEAHHVWSRRIARLAMVSALVGAALNEVALARFLTTDGVLSTSSVQVIRTIQAVLLMGALGLVAGRSRLVPLLERAGTGWTTSAAGRPAPLLALSLAVPWTLMFLFADDQRRFWWLWPLQAIVLAAAVTYLPKRLGAPSWTVRIASVAVVILVAANGRLLTRLDDWMNRGWNGRDAIEVQVVDRLAGRVRAAGERRAAIGYEIDIWRFMALFNVADSRYKAGAEFDLLLRYRHDVENTNTCAEGVSPGDRYRVVQTAPRSASPLATNRVDASRPTNFTPLDHVGVFEILRRGAETHP